MRRIVLALGVLVLGVALVSMAEVTLPEKYEEAAIVLADWLIDNRHPDVPSWPFPWDPTQTDVGISMDVARVLIAMTELTGTAAYREAAEASADFWVADNILLDEETVAGWNWDIGGNVGSYGWEEGAFDKVQYAFAKSYWPTKGEYSEVRGGPISLCGSVIRPLAGLHAFGGRYADAIDTVQQWLFTDLEKKMPPSGESEHRAYMGAQTLHDTDGDGLLGVQYQLWGSSRQSAGQNARLMKTMFDLGFQDQAVAIANWLVDVMWDEERGSFHTLFDIDEGSCMTFEEYQDYSDINARVAYGLFEAYRQTDNGLYLDLATRTLDWLLDTEMFVQSTDTGVQTYFTKPEVYGNHIIVVALAEGYTVTENPKYLSAALTTADFLIGQMDDPFTGFGGNAWSTQEVLEAVVSLLEL